MKNINDTQFAPSKNPADYRAIYSWGKALGSFDYYITAQREKAVEMKAPIDALYERDGVWTTMRDLVADHPFRVYHANVWRDSK